MKWTRTIFTVLVLAVGLLPSDASQAESYMATILRVIDGDTVDARVELGLETSRVVRLRLDGMDAPELKTARGVEVASELRGMLEGQMARVEILRKEKYGRYLAVIWLGDKNVNAWMISTGRAVEYHGGKRGVEITPPDPR
jgi:micrococcal nuclease